MGRGKYTVNEVEERTGVAGSTLRQWERRYGFPMPERSEAGYRLYSDDDVERIAAVKGHIADGVPASRAAELVRACGARSAGPRPCAALRDELVDALAALDEPTAERTLAEAHALHPLEAVLSHVVRDAMIEIGRRWRDGRANVAVEHFASSYLQGRLRALLALIGPPLAPRTLVVGCAPFERHELGPLILAVLLRRSGYRVVYVGADAPAADLREVCVQLRPAALLLSATTAEALARLERDRDLLRGAAPLLAFGGPAFREDPAAAPRLGGVYLADDAEEAIARLSERLEAIRS